MKSIQSHPIASIFPMTTREEYEALRDDIKANGIQSCGLLFEGMILDGRNRYKACEELGIRLEFEEVELGEDADKFDPVQYVLSHNLHRRHLHQSQRAMIAAKMATLKNGQRPSSNDLAQDDSAKLLNVSVPSLKRAKHVLEHGSKELISAVEQLEVTVSLAEKLCKACEDKREQSKLVKQGKAAIKTATGSPPKEKSTPAIKLPAKPTPSDVATVDAWIESQDERPVFERFRALWESTDDTGRAVIRAFIAEKTSAEPSPCN